MAHVVYIDLPCKIHGCSKYDADGYQTIILNAKDSYKKNIETYIHECKHSEDYGAAFDVDELEKVRHK